MRPAHHVEWGRVAYRDAFERQKTHWAAVKDGTEEDTIFTLEHEPVITLGRRAKLEQLHLSRESLAERGVDVVETDRGGELTYHGPGQMVAYPILNLNQWRLSIDWYLRTLEEILIAVLGEYGLTGERIQGLTGVWVQGAKVAAIGIAIKQWITYHGVALNIAPNMDHWQSIVPCGIPDKPVTSLEGLLGHAPPSQEVQQHFERHFADRFETTLSEQQLAGVGLQPDLGVNLHVNVWVVGELSRTCC